MNLIKYLNLTKGEAFSISTVYLFLLINFVIFKDSPIALINAFCGITYTFFAGKGFPFCYLFGVVGSAFYAYLSFKNALWGNLVLYLCYYVPIQIIGYFQWNKNLQDGKKEIIKTKLSKETFIKIILYTTVAVTILAVLLYYLKDIHPIMDSITTVLSIVGMYLTVKRCIEQWIMWMIVNGLSLIMWLHVFLTGEKVLSTVIMWLVYFILAFYFYFDWKKLMKNNNV